MPAAITRSFVVNSGTEAVEGALKLAHRATGRRKFVSTTGSFHGRTLGALSVIGQAKHRTPYRELLPEPVAVPFGDADAAEARDRRGLRGLHRRAHPGRGRRERAAARLSGGAAPLLRCQRRAADLRRGADRNRAHRAHVRARARGRGSRRGDARQGPRRRLSRRRLPHQRDRRLDRLARRPRHHLRREPAGLRGGERGAARDRGREAGRTRGPARRTAARAAARVRAGASRRRRRRRAGAACCSASRCATRRAPRACRCARCNAGCW